MDARLDVRGVVVQQVENVMTLVLVGTDDAGIERHVIGHVRVIDDAFLQPEVFGRIARSDGANLGFEFLPIARGTVVPGFLIVQGL